MTRSQAVERCRRDGFEVLEQERTFPNHAPLPAVICVGLPAAPPVAGSFYQVELWFCDERLCAIKLVSSAGPDYDRLRTSLSARYGEPQVVDEQGIECTQVLHEQTGCHLGARSGRSVSWLEGPPDNIRSMIKLSHATHRGDDYVFMWFTTPDAMKYWR